MKKTAKINKEETVTIEEMFTSMDLYAYYWFTLPRKASAIKNAMLPEEWYRSVRKKGAILPKPKTKH